MAGINVSELARQLRVNTKILLDVLPQYGFDIGLRAIKIDTSVATQITRKWPQIKRDMERKRIEEQEEKKRKEQELRRESGETIYIPSLITVRDLAECMRIPVTQLITELMKNGILANQNQSIDFDTASIMGGELGFQVAKEMGGSLEESSANIPQENIVSDALATATGLIARPPIVIVMGHVDHGKTKLLDTIRKTHIADKEAGGITQHIGAYQTIWKDPKTKEERLITFIDTPGHEAFTVMRSRGAKVADIAILVVAADDGVKPQTEEVIQIIRAAKLPFVVAINKIDKDTADIERVKADLSARDIIGEEWGGTVPMIGISAKANTGIDKLLDVLLLLADMQVDTIQADPDMPAIGTIIESHIDKGSGPVATVLVHTGTLRAGDPLVVNGELYGKIRAMKDHTGTLLDVALPSTPVQIIGFKAAPEVGDILDVRKAAGAKPIDLRQKKTVQTGAEKQTILPTDSDETEEEKKKTVNVLVKADVLGSLEALLGSLQKIQHGKVGVKIIGKGLGNITDDDVHKADAGGAFIIGFSVKATTLAEELMRDRQIVFRQFTIIYDVINWVKEELEKLLDVEKIVIELGILKVLAIFRREKNMMTVGGRVEQGKCVTGAKVRVKRAGEILGEGTIVQLQVGQQVVKEVPGGSECGMQFQGKVKIEVGDVLEIYSEESKVRTLGL